MVIRRFAFAVLLVLPLSIATRARAQDGPLLPGLEASSSDEPVAADDSPSEPTFVPDEAPQDEPPTYTPPVRAEETRDSIQLPSLTDDGITPLDAHGRPITGPEEPTLDFPAPPPVPRPVGKHSGVQPPLQPAPQEPESEERAPKRNLWQKSTDALRNLTRPEPKPGQSRQMPPGQSQSQTPSQPQQQQRASQSKPTQQQLDNEALRNWQMRRRQTVPQKMPQQSLRPPANPYAQQGARRVQPQGQPSAQSRQSQPQTTQNPYAARNNQPSSRRVNPGTINQGTINHGTVPRTQTPRPGYAPASRQPATSAKVDPNAPRAPWEQVTPRQSSRPQQQRVR